MDKTQEQLEQEAREECEKAGVTFVSCGSIKVSELTE